MWRPLAAIYQLDGVFDLLTSKRRGAAVAALMFRGL